MSDEFFTELLKSVREGGSILRGEKEPSRKFVVEAPNAKHIRDHYQLSQSEFATLMGVSIKTLQNWEQGRRVPRGPARILLQVAAKHPDAVWNVVRPRIQKFQSATEITQEANDDLLPEYNFSDKQGVRGKYYPVYQPRHTVRVAEENGSATTQYFTLEDGAVLLAPDVREYFPDSESVNEALRGLIRSLSRKTP